MREGGFVMLGKEIHVAQSLRREVKTSSFKILIVDDKEENIQILKTLFYPQDDVVYVLASNGEEALRILLLENDIELALIDVHLPGINGFELARHMRTTEKSKHIPIMLLTADLYAAESEFEGYDIGALDVLFKPLNGALLKSKINVFKRLKDKRVKLKEKIHQLEEVTKELNNARQAAVAADRAKSEFLANMSHEIRTPLTAIVGFTDLMKKDNPSSIEMLEYVEVITKNGRHLLGVINDILDLSKVEAGQLTIDPAIINIAKTTDLALLTFKEAALKKGIELKLVIEDNSSPNIYGDPLRVKQILLNLIGNALKFSQKGSITVSISRKGNNICCRVIDEGIGIASDRQEDLFKPFIQLTGNNAEFDSKGTGLGLCLSQKLAAKMNGSLVLEKSELGKGSIFSLTLPMGDTTLPQLPVFRQISYSENVLSGLKILVTDDSIDNQVLIKAMLSRHGAHVFAAENGAEAVELVSSQKYDLVLMDFKMPVMNGYEATEKIRESNNSIPIVFLTANAMSGEKDKVLTIGANGYVSKPIDWNDLILEILKATGASIL